MLYHAEPCEVGVASRGDLGLIYARQERRSPSTGWVVGVSPPYQMFAHHQAPSHFESQHTALYDPRWMEVFVSHVKDLDTYQEARRKLGRGPKKEEEDPKPKGAPKLKPKPDRPPKGGAKGQPAEAAQ